MSKKKNKEDALGLLNRLPALLRWAGLKNFGSHLYFNYFAPGSQYINRIDHFHGDKCQKKVKSSTKEISDTEPFNDNTPLSTLFRENHHEELRKAIESWQPYLSNATTKVDALNLTNFQFDLTAIRPVSIYMDFAHLINHDALRLPMSVLAAYMFEHSNLSISENALYVQLKRYKKMCE